MPVQNFVFSETSPNAAGNAASSQSVTNTFVGLPAGVLGFVDDYESLDVAAEIQGATGGTLDVYLQVSPDQGLNWYDVIHWAQATAGSAVKYYQAPLSQATNTTAPVQVGKNLAPALGAGVAVNGAFTDRMRLVMVAGTGTTLGVAVVVRICAQRMRIRESGE